MDFHQGIEKIMASERRYHKDAYEFIMQALFFAQKKYKRQGHLSAVELLEGAREYALQQWGALAITVLQRWGIKTTDDIGAIVFAMIEQGLMSKTEKDSEDDFKNVYDLGEALDVFRQGRSRNQTGKRP